MILGREAESEAVNYCEVKTPWISFSMAAPPEHAMYPTNLQSKYPNWER